MTKRIFTVLVVAAVLMPGLGEAQQRQKQQTQRRTAPQPRAQAKSPAPKQAGVPSAITVALRVGANVPSSELSAGFLPDLEVGYRVGMGSFAVEPALGLQLWSGDHEGTVRSSLLGSGSAAFVQEASVTVFEARARLWYDLGEDTGYPLFGIGLGGVSADTEQKSFGVLRSESGGSVTWMLQGGYAYPIAAAYGNVEVLLGYRGASVDFETAGDANLSGIQFLVGWHAAF